MDNHLETGIADFARHVAALVNGEPLQLTPDERQALMQKCEVAEAAHAQALGQYLPHLAAMRLAQLAAHGTTGQPINVDALAQQMVEAMLATFTGQFH